MTADEIIAKVDALEPGNLYGKEMKLAWLSELDGILYEEVVKTHELPDQEAETMNIWYSNPLDQNLNVLPQSEEQSALAPYTTGSEILIAGFPYGELMYTYYLRSKIADSNHETVKYNQMATQYNSAYQQFANYYNRTHMPKRPVSGNRFKF